MHGIVIIATAVVIAAKIDAKAAAEAAVATATAESAAATSTTAEAAAATTIAAAVPLLQRLPWYRRGAVVPPWCRHV